MSLLQSGWLFDWTTAANVHGVKMLYGQSYKGLCAYHLNDGYVTIDLIEKAPSYRFRKNRDGVVGYMLAYVAKVSFSVGFEGYIQLKVKTTVMDHFSQVYDAKPIGRQVLTFDTVSSLNLIETYPKKG